MTRNQWYQVLGIGRPSLAAAADCRANSYALLLVALLERGQPMMTLLDVAARFEEVGIAILARR